MGANFSTHNLVDNVTNFVTGRKRKHSESEDDEVSKVIDIVLHTPKKKKLLCTAKYIYQALFLEGKNSDVTVCALGKEHRLHRVYLCQSPYFASMFGGSWLETTQKYITIDVVDPLITLDSLQVVFGSLYNSDIALNPLEIVPILATATMFQLDGLIEQCTEVIMETINSKTAIDYYQAACQYGDRKLTETCLRWFLVNLMTHYSDNKELRNIPATLMRKLVAHPDLFTIQTEYSIYVLLKCWIYLIQNPEEGEIKISAVNAFYQERTDKTPFLYTAEGREYMPVFQELRLPYLISHQLDVMLILKDNIIPKSWFNPVVFQQWKSVLKVDRNDEKGPNGISNENFLKECQRCGRVIGSRGTHTWRWTGFHFGVDLLMTTENGNVSIKRNHRSEFEQLLSFQATRHIAIRVTAATLNEQKQISYMKQSEILTVSLSKGEEVSIMSFDKDLQYPVILSVNLMYTTPETEQNQNQVSSGSGNSTNND